jgi:hypothetical protein
MNTWRMHERLLHSKMWLSLLSILNYECWFDVQERLEEWSQWLYTESFRGQRRSTRWFLQFLSFLVGLQLLKTTWEELTVRSYKALTGNQDRHEHPWEFSHVWGWNLQDRGIGNKHKPVEYTGLGTDLSKESKGLTYHSGNRKLLSTSRHSVKVQWWQALLISCWVWDFIIERSLHCPISGNAQQGSVADSVNAAQECWSGYRGKDSSEIRAELHMVGNWSDMQVTEEISFHLGHW